MTEMLRNNRIMRLVREGLSYADVADMIPCSRSVVAGVVCRRRATKPNPKKVCNRKQFGESLSIVQASRDCGVTEFSFRKRNGIND